MPPKTAGTAAATLTLLRVMDGGWWFKIDKVVWNTGCCMPVCLTSVFICGPFLSTGLHWRCIEDTEINIPSAVPFALSFFLSFMVLYSHRNHMAY